MNQPSYVDIASTSAASSTSESPVQPAPVQKQGIALLQPIESDPMKFELKNKMTLNHQMYFRLLVPKVSAIFGKEHKLEQSGEVIFDSTVNFSYVTSGFAEQFQRCKFESTKLRPPKHGKGAGLGIAVHYLKMKEQNAAPRMLEVKFRIKDEETGLISRVFTVTAVVLKDISILRNTLFVGNNDILDHGMKIIEFGRYLTGLTLVKNLLISRFL